MQFFRPEAIATLRRWREAIVGAILASLGLWWMTGPGGLFLVPAAAFLLAGGGLIAVGLQRARFRSDQDGTGAVELDEGKITYFGPLSGGSIALADIERLTLDTGQYPAHWLLEQVGQSGLMIPINAVGAETLFDAFARLPGLKTERMLAELKSKNSQAVVIWERRNSRPVGARLH